MGDALNGDAKAKYSTYISSQKSSNAITFNESLLVLYDNPERVPQADNSHLLQNSVQISRTDEDQQEDDAERVYNMGDAVSSDPSDIPTSSAEPFDDDDFFDEELVQPRARSNIQPGIGSDMLATIRSAQQMGSCASQRLKLLELFDRFYTEAQEGLERIMSGELTMAGLGGRAGGAKYIWKTVLFKRADDMELLEGYFMYGGPNGPCRYWAGKAASNELKASNTLFRLFFENQIDITIPIQILFDCQGQRYVAMTLLPLEGASLIYGSSDCGQTIHADDDHFNKLVAMAAEKLHLAGHTVVTGDKRLRTIHLAGDVEGHRTIDGHYLLLDLARMWPPEAVSRAPPTSVFFRLLRPEFLAYLKSIRSPPLSPDALSGWAAPSRETSLHNSNIYQATETLLKERIPSCVAFLQEQIDNDVPDVRKLVKDTPPLAAKVIKAALVPIRSLLNCPAQLLPALHVTLLHHCNTNGEIPFGRWSVFQLADNPLWSKVYRQYHTTLQLSAVLHNFGIPVRHLADLLVLSTSKLLRKLLRLEMIRRSIKVRVRWLLSTSDLVSALALLDHLERGETEDKDMDIITKIMAAKYNATFPSRLKDYLVENGKAIAQYVRVTCGIQDDGKLVARVKPNTFIAVVRALHHFDNAVQASMEPEYFDLEKEAELHEVRIKELQAALEICKEVAKSDPSDPSAIRLLNRCRVLINLAKLRAVALERVDRVALDNATTLRQWFALCDSSQVTESGGTTSEAEASLRVGVAIVGDNKLCLAFAGAVQASPSVLQQFKVCQTPQIACTELMNATFLRCNGLLNALFELECSTQNVSTTPNNKVQVRDIGALVVRKPGLLDKEKDWMDGGEGQLGQVMGEDLEHRSVVFWRATGETQCIQEAKLQTVDDIYLELVCGTGNIRKAFAKLNQRGSMWNAVSGVGQFLQLTTAVSEKDVRAALVEAWRMICQAKDALSLSLIRSYLSLDQELLRMAMRENYEEGMKALIKAKDNPYSEVGEVPTIHNNALLYGADLEMHDQVRLLLQLRPVTGARRAQTLLCAVDISFSAVDTLLKAGFEANLCDDENNTALHYAARRGDQLCVQLLLQSNAFVNAVNIKHQPVVDWAVNSNAKMVLQSHGAESHGKLKIPLLHRLDTVGIPHTVTGEISKHTALVLSSINVTEALYRANLSDFAQFKDAVRITIIEQMKQLLDECDVNFLSEPALQSWQVLKTMETFHEEETATVIKTLWKDEHVRSTAATTTNFQLRYAQLLFTRVAYISQSSYSPAPEEVVRVQIIKSKALIGPSFVSGVNIMEITALSPTQIDMLTTTKSAYPFAKMVILLLTPADLRPDQAQSLDALLDRFNTLCSWMPDRGTSHQGLYIWLIAGDSPVDYALTHLTNRLRVFMHRCPRPPQLVATARLNLESLSGFVKDTGK